MSSRLYKQLSLLLILCLCTLQSQRVLAIACADIFTNGIQAHANNGNIHLDFHSEIKNGSPILTAKTLTDNSAWPACSGSNCVVTGTPAITSTPAFVIGDGANGAVNVGAAGTLSIASGNYKTVDVGQQGKLIFSTANGSYKTGPMTTQYQSSLELSSGDYWIDGNLTIGQETVLRRMESTGSTRIFVKGNVTFAFNAHTNGFTSNQLLIYATGSITSAVGVNLSAYLYAGGNVALKFKTVINGAVSGANFVGGIGESNELLINYEGANLSAAQFSPFCSGASQPASYVITNNATGLTCAAEQITVTALNASGDPYSPPAGTEVSLTTNPTTGVWVGSNLNTYTYTFHGGENSFFTYLQQTTPETLVINAIGATATGASSITFKDVGLKIAANFSQNPPPAVVNQIAGVPGAARLKVIRKDDNTGACIAQVGAGTRPVSLAYTCVDPTTCIPGQAFTVYGNGIAANNNGTGLAYTSVNLTFDNNGEAPLAINYSDVGQIRLSAQLSLPAAGNDPAMTLTGGSDLFVVKPQSIVVSEVQRLDGTSNPGGTSASGTAAQFVAAGEQFKVLVEARNGATPAALTPNFGRENLPETKNLKIKTQSIVHPANGTATDLTVAGAIASTTPQGTFVYNDVRWNQVGSILIAPHFDDGDSATTADGDYLGSGNIPNLVASTTVGRFYPDHFTLINPTLANSCSSFSYMSQPLALKYTIEARSLNNNILSNYGPAYGTMPSITYVAENVDSGVNLERFSDGITKTWVNGTLIVDSLVAMFSRALPSGAPDGPYGNLQIGLQLTDNFDSRVLQDLDMNATTMGICTSQNCTQKRLGEVLNMHYARLRIDDAFGPETADLPVNFVVEHWVGNLWAKNESDSCTAIARNNIFYGPPEVDISTEANLTISIDGGATTGSYADMNPSADPAVVFTGGDAGHKFSAPGTGTGSFFEKINLASYPWLTFDWNQSGGTPTSAECNLVPPEIPDADCTLRANFNFGSYRGHDRAIYWREILQ